MCCSSVLLVLFSAGHAIAAPTTLFEAVASRDADSTRHLLDWRASHAVRDYHSKTPLHITARAGHLDITKVLLAFHADPNAKDARGSTPLNAAAAAGHVPVLQLLLHNFAQPDETDEEGKAALHAIASHGHAAAVSTLVANRASVALADRAGRTPMHAAAERGHSNVARLLVSHGASSNIRDTSGCTPLCLAALSGLGGPNAVSALLNMRAEVDAKDAAGRTPLHWASMAGHAMFVQALIDRGADSTIRDQDRHTARDYAIVWKSPPVAAGPAARAVKQPFVAPSAMKVLRNSESSGDPVKHTPRSFPRAVSPVVRSKGIQTVQWPEDGKPQASMQRQATVAKTVPVSRAETTAASSSGVRAPEWRGVPRSGG